MIRWFSPRRLIVPLILLGFLIFFLRFNRENHYKAYTNQGEKVVEKGAPKTTGDKTDDVPVAKSVKEALKSKGTASGIDESKLAPAKKLVLSAVAVRPFELTEQDLPVEFQAWNPKQQPLGDFLWDRYQVMIMLPPGMKNEAELGSLQSTELYNVFKQSILRHVSLFYGDYLRAGGIETRHLPIADCTEIGLETEADEKSSKFLDSLAGSQGEVKFKRIPYYTAERRGPFVTEKDGSIWMVAKYFKIKEKKKGKKGDAQADSPRDAVRLLKKNKEKSKSNFNRELAALKVLNHPNIVHGVCYNQSRLEIVYPFLRGGDLVPLEDDSLGLKIIKAGGRTSEILNPDQTFLPRFAKQLILAVAHMHKNDLVHFDLKPENFVVAGPNRQFIRQIGSQALEAYDLVLIDFGLAEIESRLTDTCHKAGTEVTMAPEQIICNNPAGFGTDWWGVAAGLYRVRVFWEPSIDETERDRIMHLRDPQWGHVIMPRQPFFSREFGDLLELMLKPNPDDRNFDTRLQELLDHPYIKSATTL